MKLNIFDLQKHKSGEKELPQQFQEEYRPDLIRRAVNAVRSATRQPYGTSPEAGMRSSSKLSKRRRKYRGCYGLGISRVNRKILSRRGTRFFWVGAFSPQTVGGRRAHPPKAEKIRVLDINKNENRKAIRSAISATLDKVIVQKRGHKIPIEYPFIIKSNFESIAKTAEMRNALKILGFEQDLVRSSTKKVRAGTGKTRGRRYQKKKSILIVVSGDCPALKSARNLMGVDIVPVCALNAELLAPGAMPGRAALWTEKAIEELETKKLFL